MEQQVFFDAGPARADLLPERVQGHAEVRDRRVGRALGGQLCRMNLEDRARLDERLDVVAIQLEQIGDEPFQCGDTQACDDRPALRKRLQDALTLHLAERLAYVASTDTEALRQHALRRQ